MDQKLYQKAFFAIIFLTLIAVSFLIIKPFLTALLTGIVFSYIFYPVYKRILKRIPNKNASAFIASILVILVITMPLFFVLNTISKEAYATYILSRQKASNAQLLSSECQPADKSACKIMNYIAEKANDPQIKYYLDTTIKGAATRITGKISDILRSIPIFMLHMFITLFVMFFLFKDGNLLINKIGRLLPLKEKHRDRVLKKLNDMTSAVIYGSIAIAIIQGTLGGIGFFILGLPTPLLWGLVMMFASLIPYVGSSIVWLPAALLLILNGYIDADPTFIIRGILLIVYGIFVVGTIDNILKPKIIGEKGGLHPVLVLLGVVGGLQLLGFIGVIIGPILLALLVAFVNIYEEEKG
ncbi:AI-2E family transporter [Candidatus Woesearchaeota archaeon]|nr:AI-2E family transporter [Candidatus Woesearchaeota archaeon]